MASTTAGGLQRRRAPAAAATPDASGPSSRPLSPTSRTASPAHGSTRSNGAAASSAGGSAVATSLSDGAGHHRIAYDPRDLDDEGESMENPRLTLMEECLLLGLKDRQGYLSFWNDNISYTLRGCILIELALRRRIAISREFSGSARARSAGIPLQDRVIEVIDGKMTGEVLLDEALKLIKGGESMSASQWVDLLSGETWNVTKIGYQLKQVRERLAKGLVDKGILRTEKRNFLLFDMATHPVADSNAKDAVLRRILSLLTSSSPTLHASALYREERGRKVAYAATRSLALLCCAFSANVLENALTHLSYDAREAAFQKVDDLLADFSQWPMAPRSGAAVGTTSSAGVGAGSRGGGGGGGIGEGSLQNAENGPGVSSFELAKAVRADLASGTEQQFECIAAVLYVLSRMDSLL